MRPGEVRKIAAALGTEVLATDTLAGGFSHETCLLTLTDGRVVVRIGGPDPAIEAAVMEAARHHVPVPRVLLVVPSPDDGATRPVMVLEHVAGTPLSQVLTDEISRTSLRELGSEVGRIAARIGSVTFDRRGFFADERLTVREEPPWSEQLPGFAESCMSRTPEARLDQETRRAWAELCTAQAPALARIDDHTRLVHSDLNPKNILVTRTPGGWRVDAVLDWEFSHSGCTYADAANMARFGAAYPDGFLDGFTAAFAEHPADRHPADRGYLGRVMDMFALSDLVTRPLGHPIADQAADLIRQWVTDGVPRAC
jgi:Ser/Thr protein kinase RdoA (MazF antagonist)